MKNRFKYLGIIVITAMIIISMTACSGAGAGAGAGTGMAGKDPLSGNVTIDNTSPNVGDDLILEYDGNGTGTASWQVLRDNEGWTGISGSGDSNWYTVLAADLDKTLRFRVSFADQDGWVLSDETTDAVTSIQDLLTGQIEIDVDEEEIPEEGDTISITILDGNGSGDATWQVQRGDGAWETIGGATDDTLDYTVSAGDAGRVIRFRVKFENNDGWIFSDPLTIFLTVLEGTVGINNTSPKVEEVLTITFTGNGSGAASWEIQRDAGAWTSITGTTNPVQYTVAFEDSGKTLAFRVSFADRGGNKESEPTDAVAKADLTGSIGIDLSYPGVDDDLVITYSGNGTGAASWEIQRDSEEWVSITGTGNPAVYTIVPGDLDKTLAFRVSFADQEGTRTSSATDAILPFGISAKTLTLTIQQTAVLEARADVEWSSSNEAMAIVDENGRVVAVGADHGDVSFTWAMNNATAHFLIGNIVETRTVSSARGWNQYSATDRTRDGSAVITATRTSDGATVNVSVTTTTAATTALGTLADAPPLKDQFEPYFYIGNIVGTGDGGNPSPSTNTTLRRHFNILTYENQMKPNQMAGTLNTTSGVLSITAGATIATRVNTVRSNNFLLHGHVLYWHDQNINWAGGTNGTTNTNLETVRTNLGVDGVIGVMDQYAMAIAGREGIKGQVRSWDVINELFVDDNAFGTPANAAAASWQQAVRQGAVASSYYVTTLGGTAPAGLTNTTNNPWARAIGPADMVYYSFLSVRKADPAALLVYNDFNTNFPNKRRWIADMIEEINNRYAASGDKQEMIALGEDPDRKLIEVLGFQEHHNLSHQYQHVFTSIEYYLSRNLGIKFAMTEVDIVGMTSAQFNGSNNTQQLAYYNIVRQAQYYYDLFSYYLKHHEHIEFVTFWGFSDNWRRAGQPLPWTHANPPLLKPAYWGIQRALEDYEAGVVWDLESILENRPWEPLDFWQ